MNLILALLNDLVIMIFDLALYIKLTPLKNDSRKTRVLMYSGVAAITLAYGLATYVFGMPYAAASFCCMTVPSFLMFLSLSKYKSSRFLVTFCFVDTVTLVIAACAKVATVLGGTAGGLASLAVLVVLCSAGYWILRPYCPQYRDLMSRVSKGWAPMAVSTVFIYLLLTVSAAYPKPLLQRMEYLPVYFLLCLTVLTFYAVFIVLIVQKAKLSRAYALLQQQKHWQELAYLDELTQLANPAAYAARTGELEQHPEPDRYLMVFDIDNFKHINDTYGHLAGNEVLKKTADFFLSAFSQENYEFFRIGGDEFAAIVSGLTQSQVSEKVNRVNAMRPGQSPGCTISCGCARVDFSENTPFESAFLQADRAMYAVKSAKKSAAG